MAMAAPSAPLAKGNKQGTGCWLCCRRTQSVCNAACPARGLGSHAVYLYQTGEGLYFFFFFWSTAGNSWDSYIPGEMAEELGAKKHRRSGITQSISAAHILQASRAAYVTGQRVTARTPSVASTSEPSSWHVRGGQRRSRELCAPGSEVLSSTAHKGSTQSPASFPPWAVFGHPLCPQHPVCLHTNSPVRDKAPLQPLRRRKVQSRSCRAVVPPLSCSWTLPWSLSLLLY